MGILDAAASFFGQKSANKTNIRLARENRDWQERMSNTAYTRAAADLENAGLNRILALGSPASTPQGNVATVGNVGAGGTGIEDTIATAMQVRRMRQEVNNMRASEKDVNAAENLKRTQARTELGRQALMEAQAKALQGAAEAGDIMGGTISSAKKRLQNKDLDWESMWDQLKRDATKTKQKLTHPNIKMDWWEKLKERDRKGTQEAIEYRRRNRQ